MAVSAVQGALLPQERGLSGPVINQKDNTAPQALGYSGLWFISS